MIRFVVAMTAALVSVPAAAALNVFTADLTGPNEFPPVASPGIGTAIVSFDDGEHTLRIQAAFSGLLGTSTVAHIHCCVSPAAADPRAGVATTTPSFPGFPDGVTSGTYDETFDLTEASSFNAAFVTAQGGVPQAEAALVAGLFAGHAYFNVHSSQFGPGEIRGFLTLVPEPQTYALLGLGLLGMAFAVRARRKVH